MDEKLCEEAKPKISRSQARHERRKRLTSALKALKKESAIVSDDTKIQAAGSADCKSPENRHDTESVSKSKARRLRKRNRTEDSIINIDNNTGTGSPASQISECAQKAPNEDNCTAEPKPKGDKVLVGSRSDIIESNFVTKQSESKKVSATEHELLENEKNLKISESLRPNATISNNSVLLESQKISAYSKRESNVEFIIKKDSRKIDVTSEKNNKSSRVKESSERDKSAKIPASSGGRKDKTSDEVSLPRENPIELPKFCVTSELMSSDPKMSLQEKTREQIKAEREAKKAAKAAGKVKGKVAKPEVAEKIVEKTLEAPSTKESTMKIFKDERIDEVDGEIIAMTSKLTISGSKKKPEVDIADDNAEAKSKAELRAERRAKQEAQRAAKLGQVSEKSRPKVTKIKNVTIEPTKISTAPTINENLTKKVVKRSIVKESAHEVNLFKHLYHEREQALINVPTVNSTIHPAIVRLGVQYAKKVIVGSNARCVALLAAVKQLIEDFERPPQADFTRGLEASLQESSTYLHHCRPLAVSMQNALRHLKWQMTQLHATILDEEAKTKLGNAIDTYIQEQIHLADKAISITIQTKISNGDVILTYGFSSLIHKILCDAYDAGRQFRVVVVDGRPWLEGREQLRRLTKHGIECSYVLINALSFIMPEVSKVFLGAHAILANGALMSRVGTAQVALMSKTFNVPVLVACETHKTCERVQTDSIVYNEIADPDELSQNLMGSSKNTSLANWRAKKSLNLLNLTYDVTPADLVTAVVTELAILPCTSVPVILRIKPSEI